MKIVFLTYLHGFGGAEKQNIMLANAMVERGHDVTVVSISSNNNCYDLDNRIKYVFLPDRKKGLLRIVTRYQDIKNVLKCIKPDLTISFWFQTAYMTAFMNKKYTGKVIYSERGDPGDSEYKGALGIVRIVSLPRIDGFVFQTRGAQNYFDRKVKQRSIVIPNPVFIDREKFPQTIVKRKAIVTVGRLHPQKNQLLLIDAFASIASRIPEYTLEIYGDGILKSKLQTHIEELGLENRVYLKGTSNHIHSIIYDATMFVLSSDFEGLPNTLLEAMALGLPCISTDCRPGGAREIIDNDYDGIIVPIGDCDKLSVAMLQLINDENKQIMLSNNAVVKMKTFSPKEIYNHWELYMASIIQK